MEHRREKTAGDKVHLWLVRVGPNLLLPLRYSVDTNLLSNRC